MTAHCPNCGASLPPDARECPSCPWDVSLPRERPPEMDTAMAFKPINPLKPALLAAAILAGGYLWLQRSPGGSAGFDPTRDATADIATAVSEARRTGRRVFIEVGGNWCAWCHRLQAFLASQPELKKLLENRYVVVKVNVSPEKPNSVPLARFPQILGYPHFFVLDQDGALLASQMSDDFEASGDTYDPEKFRAFLFHWATPQ